MIDLRTKRDQFEKAYTLSATDDERSRTIEWMRWAEDREGYSLPTLQDNFVGFCLALSTHISIQEAWELAGGNPGINATREELESALKALDEVCDEAEETISLSEVWTRLGGDSALEKPALKDVRNLLEVVAAAQSQRKPRGAPLTYSMGFRGPMPDRNGNVYEKMPEVPPEMQTAFEKSLNDLRSLAGGEADVIFLVNTSRDPKAPYRVVRTKEREPNTDSDLHFEMNLDAPLMAPVPDVQPSVKRRTPKVTAGDRIRVTNEVPISTLKAVQKMGREILRIRKSLNMNQTEFGKLIGLEQTAVSAAERGKVTKYTDGGVSAIDKAHALLKHIKEVCKNG